MLDVNTSSTPFDAVRQRQGVSHPSKRSSRRRRAFGGGSRRNRSRTKTQSSRQAAAVVDDVEVAGPSRAEAQGRSALITSRAQLTSELDVVESASSSCDVDPRRTKPKSNRDASVGRIDGLRARVAVVEDLQQLVICFSSVWQKCLASPALLVVQRSNSGMLRSPCLVSRCWCGRVFG